MTPQEGVGRLRNDKGEVAVLYSPGYGAGWFSWNSGIPACLYDAEVAQAVLDGDNARAAALAKAKWPDGYWGGSRDLKIEWMSAGTAFRIDEYDGFESVVYSSEQNWNVA